MSDMLDVLGDRKIVIAREITKLHEEFARGSLKVIISELGKRNVKGEVLILVSPATSTHAPGGENFRDPLCRYLLVDKLSVKDAVKKVSQETGIKRGVLYEEALLILKEYQS